MRPTVVVTGASDGIGAAAVRELVKKDVARIVITGRSKAKTGALAEELGVEHVVSDFARLDDVRKLAHQIREATDRVDVLVNNAGGVYGQRRHTVDNFETTLQVNYLAPFLLTNLLLDRLQDGQGAVVSTTSGMAGLFGRLDIEDLNQTRAYSPERAYANAKLAGLIFSHELELRFADRGIRTMSFDPGGVRTNFGAESGGRLRLIYRTPVGRMLLARPERAGALLAGYVAGAADGAWKPGGHYVGTRLLRSNALPPQVGVDEIAQELWRRTSEMVGVARVD